MGEQLSKFFSKPIVKNVASFLNIYTIFTYSDTNSNSYIYYTVQQEPLMIEEQLFVKQAVRNDLE